VAIVVICIAAVCVYAFSGMKGLSGVSESTETNSATSTPIDSLSKPAGGAALADDVVMTLWGSADTYMLRGEEYIESGCNATQAGVGNIASSVTAQGSVDASKIGDYTITYTATTAQGTIAQATRTVHVVDSFDSGVASSVPTLMYHYVYSADDVPENLNSNYILDTDLAAQLIYLNENNYYYPSYQELRAFIDGTHSLPAKSVILTFDDGDPSFLAHGIPVLNEYKVPATSFIEGWYDEESGVSTLYASPYVQFQSHSYNMHHGGSGVGQGGVIHAMTEAEIYADCVSAEQVIGPIYAMAYPYGDNNETAWAALQEAGVLCAFTVVNNRDYPGDNPYALNRVRILGTIDIDSFAGLVAPN
jgi:peptidoglycan/xylan/chitin deacetylase (PgdA/CDA1 family)